MSALIRSQNTGTSSNGLFSLSPSAAADRRRSSALARQTRQETDQIAASTEIAAVREQGYAFLASQAMTNVTTLISQAEAQMKIAPGGAQFYEAIIAGYAIGAGQRIARAL